MSACPQPLDDHDSKIPSRICTLIKPTIPSPSLNYTLVSSPPLFLPNFTCSFINSLNLLSAAYMCMSIGPSTGVWVASHVLHT